MRYRYLVSRETAWCALAKRWCDADISVHPPPQRCDRRWSRPSVEADSDAVTIALIETLTQAQAAMEVEDLAPDG